ncbi:MAG: DNA repair protein [archaeon]|nr:DNA repair protein [archaeon]
MTKEEKIKISNGEDLYQIMLKILEREEGLGFYQEHFWVVGLALDHMLIFVELVALGTSNRFIVDPREVFYMAVYKHSKYVVLVHNHPKGTLLPSEKDEDWTDKLIHAAELLNLKVIDHLIITKKGCYSFNIMGNMEKLEQSKKYAVYFIEEEKLLKKGEEKGFEKGKEEGKEEGLKEGIEKGEGKKALEMAKAMKQKGIDIQTIKEISGLSINEIENL